MVISLGVKVYKWLSKITIMTIVFTYMPYFVYATECKEVRLDQTGSAFDKIPVYNQLDFRGVDASVCYAIASSQLVDEYRFRKGDSLQTLSSPLSLAISFKEYSDIKYRDEIISTDNISSSILGGGFIEETLLAVGRTEICDQNTIENEVGLMQSDSFTNVNKKSAQQFVENVLLEGNKPKINSFSKLDYLGVVKRELKNRCQGNTHSIDKIAVESLSQGNYLDDLKNHMNSLSDLSLSDEQKIKLNLEFLRKHDKEKQIQKFQKKINLLLDQRIPIGIGYFVKVLQKKLKTDEYGAHASIITGQRWNRDSGSCELLIRDSYGSSCNDERGENRYVLPCEKGSVWVDAKILLGNTDKITWIP